MRYNSNRFFSAVPTVVSVSAGLMFFFLTCLLVAGQPGLSDYYSNRSLLTNLALMPAALTLVALLMYARARQGGVTPESQKIGWLLRALFAALLAVQFLVVRCAWYKMGWDIANVYETAEELARGQALSSRDYFQLCPNNAPLTILQALPLWLAVQLGLAVPFVVLPYIDALLLNLTAYITVLCAWRLTQSRWARGFVLVVSVCWIGLSPYLLYPYTDTFAILFPVLALYICLVCRRPALKWFLFSFVCFLGASIKPTVLILLIAFLLLGICRFFARKNFSFSAWKRAFLLVMMLAVGALPGKAFERASIAYLAGSAVPQNQLSETHYLMLGMNGETYGGHSPDDVLFSQSFDTLAKRQQANLRVARERFLEKGVAGNLRFFITKAYKAYADGSFAANSSFLDLEIPKRTDALSAFVRSLYHHRGSLNQVCHTIAQGIWLVALMMCALAAILRRRHPIVALLSLTLIGATGYLLLFEVWPRYLFIFAPLFVLLASMALDRQPRGTAQRKTAKKSDASPC